MTTTATALDRVADGADVGDRLTAEAGGLGKRSEGRPLALRDSDHTITVRDLVCGALGEQGSGSDGGADRIVARTN